jgi:hypothetical protein
VNIKFVGFWIQFGLNPPVFGEFQKMRPNFLTLITSATGTEPARAGSTCRATFSLPLDHVISVFSFTLDHDTRATTLWQNHLEKGFIVRINLSDSQWSENTINTYKYNIIYWSSGRSYYNLCSRISYIEEAGSQNYSSKDKSAFAKVISLNGQNIFLP